MVRVGGAWEIVSVDYGGFVYYIEGLDVGLLVVGDV